MGEVALLLQPTQYKLDQLDVLVLRLAVHNDVVDEDEHSLVQPRMQHSSHLSLERARRILHTERHHRRLIQPGWRTHRHQLATLLLYRYLVEALQQVELTEVLHAGQLIEHRLHQRQRLGVCLRHIVQAAVVATYAPSAHLALLVALRHDDQLSRPLAAARLHSACGHFISHPLGGGLYLGRRQATFTLLDRPN